MAVITDSIILDALLTLVPLLYLSYWFFTYNFDHWEKRGVPSNTQGVILGALLRRETQAQSGHKIYQSFSGQRYGGFFLLRRPALMIMDPDLINKIMVKDFNHFSDRPQPVATNDPLNSESLLSLKGQHWRSLRYKLTPTFSSGKLKGMFEQLSKCGENMVEKIRVASKSNAEIESKSLTYEFTLDVIASCAFGLQFKPGSEDFQRFTSYVNMLFKPPITVNLKFLLMMALPKIAQLFNVLPFPTEMINYFVSLIKSTMQYRKDNNIKRNDYFQLLLTLREQEESGKDVVVTAAEDDEIVNQLEHAGHHQPPPNTKLFTDNAICANTFIFLTAGSESTSSTVSFALYELSRHPEIQQQLQEEVDSVLDRHGTLSYTSLKEMTYLDQVIQETQRLYPILGMLFRECSEDYKMPDSDLVIEKGVLACIPVIGLHKDPQYYPNPDQFDPERFRDNNYKPNSAFLPFGDGPRICIAMRFAILEVKTCLARIISEFSVELSDKTDVPLQFDPKSFLTSAKGGIWLKFQQRKKTN